MEFRLIYSGELTTAQHVAVANKHAIRRQLHPQLRDLYRRAYGIRISVKRFLGTGPGRTEMEAPAAKYRFRGFQFVPLISGESEIGCQLDILFLRREPPGSLITKPKDEYGGDLDNRLKTFFDGLRLPAHESEVPPRELPDPDVQPFYCLLEDDSLITKLQVDTDTLLGDPTQDAQTHVHLIVRVTTRPIQDHSL